MASQKHKLGFSLDRYTSRFSAPGSADTPTIYSDVSSPIIRTYFEGRGNEESLLAGKITELLHKEFGDMPLRVFITPHDMDPDYEIRVRYGIEGSHYICENIDCGRVMEIREGYGWQMVAEVTADKLIHYIRRDVMDTMFGSEEEKTVGKVPAKSEKAFRKILI